MILTKTKPMSHKIAVTAFLVLLIGYSSAKAQNKALLNKTIAQIDSMDREWVKRITPFQGEGYTRLYRKDQKISRCGVFKKSKMMTGKVYNYDSLGTLQSLAVYADWKYIGDAPLPKPSLDNTFSKNIGMCNKAVDTLHYKQLEDCPFTVNDNPNMRIISFVANFSASGGITEQTIDGNRIGSDLIVSMKKAKATKLYLNQIKATDGKKTYDLGNAWFFVRCPNCW